MIELCATTLCIINIFYHTIGIRVLSHAKVGVNIKSFLSFSLHAPTHTFSRLQFTNQIAMGGDNVDTVYFNLESRDLVGRVDGERKRRLGY